MLRPHAHASEIMNSRSMVAIGIEGALNIFSKYLITNQWIKKNSMLIFPRKTRGAHFQKLYRLAAAPIHAAIITREGTSQAAE